MISARIGYQGMVAKVNEFNRLMTSTPDFFIEAALGRVKGISSISKFGRNPDIGTATDPEDVWGAGGLWVAPTQERIHNVASSSANDDVGNTGAQRIRIEGLDRSFSPQTEDVDMNGTSDVATAKAYTRIYRAYVLESGSNGTNVGDITMTAQTDLTVTAQIDADLGQTEMAIYTVPSGFMGLILSVYAVMGDSGGGSAAYTDLRLIQVSNVDTGSPTSRVQHTFSLITAGNSHYEHLFRIPLIVHGPADLILRATEVSNNSTVVSGGFDMLLVNGHL